MISDFLPTANIAFTMANNDGILQPFVVELVAVSQLTAMFRVRERVPGVTTDDDDRCLAIRNRGYVLIKATMSRDVIPAHNAREIVLACLSSASDDVPFLRKRIYAMYQRGRLLIEIAINACAGVFVDANPTEELTLYRNMLLRRMSSTSSRRTKCVRTSPYNEFQIAAPGVASPIEAQ